MLKLADDYHKSLQFSSLAYTLLRSIYFGNYIILSKKKNANIREDCINKQNSDDLIKESQVTLLDCLTYCFYMPMLTFGQLTVFEQFRLQVCETEFSLNYQHTWRKHIKFYNILDKWRSQIRQEIFM